ncbi:hypothetical protein [Demequina capsici]|uniref:Uncharacterized protein n=1 Tax=Demequina capsici TaxID=3075620 RepID=A0AA96FCG4_9MICO|nr:hypothetical protein [Demequina sp. OYTSA14]WNM25775.1 hypothetical protein RN606_06395 [Demequina sp. OYTSA14]
MREHQHYGPVDRGSALVAAVGVAIIGMMLVAVVVTQAVMVTNDSQRDRVRTTEVHSAEAAVDATLASLRTGAICSRDYTYGTGTTATTVTVSLKYYDDSTELTCASGTLSDTATKAVVTATSTPVNPGIGIQPERIMEATVNLQAIATSIPGAALFSGGTINPGGGYNVSAAADSEAAAVWQDSGDWLCNPNNTSIDGSVFVPNGSATFQSQGCYVTGNVYAKTFIQAQVKAANGGYHIGGNAVAFSGNLVLNNPITIKGNLAVGGTVPLGTVQWKGSSISGTVCSANTTVCPGLEYYTPVGLPEIDYYPAEWTGWTLSNKAGFATQVENAWYPTFTKSWQNTNLASDLGNCTVPANMSDAIVNFPSDKSKTKTVYDMRDCALKIQSHSGNTYFTMNLWADTVLFVKSLDVTNGLVVQSGDGKEHQFAIIVADGGTQNNGVAECTTRSSTGYTPGNISLSSAAITVAPEITIFMYTPCNIGFQNKSTSYGQIYGGTVTVGQTGTEFIYKQVNLPGVALTIDQSSASSGYYVQIASKREMR